MTHTELLFSKCKSVLYSASDDEILMLGKDIAKAMKDHYRTNEIRFIGWNRMFDGIHYNISSNNTGISSNTYKEIAMEEVQKFIKARSDDKEIVHYFKNACNRIRFATVLLNSRYEIEIII